LQRIRAITLDLDDTLWEIEPVIRRAEAKLWQWLAENYPLISTSFSATDVLDIRVSVMEEYADQQHDFRFLRKKVLARLAQEAGYATDLVEPAFEVFDRARNEVELFPDVLANLEALAENFTILALTNGNASLQKIGIDHLFHDAVTATDVGAAKPAREIFEVAIERSGYSAIEILHVGDHPETDIDGAREAGMQTAWMNRTSAEWPEHLPQPDVVVTTVADLRRLLEAARLGREEIK
jgi:putative hydrolase of the HAD superfamily